MATVLYRVGVFAARFHILVIVGWVVVLALVVGGAQLLGGTLVSSFSIPGTQSQNALDMLQQRFPQASGASAKVIYVAPSGQSISSFETQVDASVAQLKTLDHVSGVTGPWDQGADAQIAPDGSMAYASVQYDVPSTSLTDADDAAVVSAGDLAATDGVTVGFAGVADPPEAGVDYTEAIGLVIAFIVLVITFGSLLAAGMPLVTALVGVGLASMAITIASGFASISSTAPLLATMLGLAVGIDYALFIVSRHRAQLARGVPARESIAMAVATAGSAVVFAGLTVIIALLGLAVVQIPFLTVMGVGAAIAVVCAVVVALTLLPALLALFGRLLVPRAGSRAARREIAAPGEHPTLSRRWVRLITAKPVITVVVTVVGLLVLAVPATQMRLTLPDAGYDPPGSQSREGYDLLASGFGPGFNGPLLVTADISSTLDIQGALTALHDEFTGLPDVASVSQAIPNATVDMAIVSIIPDSSPDSDQTVQLVQSIRERAAGFEADHGFSYQVTGQTALGIDVSQRLADALLPFALVVVGLCIVLLTIVFRSLAVPITATVGYLLSVIASFGVVTAVFEWGWLADPVIVAKVGPVISFMPILVMAVLFGLAMDYEVFLVSRMREEFVEHGDAHRAVVDGFSGAARVVTAAACIMFSVFASFVPGGNAILQPIAMALAVGVFLDAFVVRMTLIPALMMLLGRLAWALPRPLARVLPDVDLEGVQVHGMLAARDWRPRSATPGAAAASGAAGSDADGSDAAGSEDEESVGTPESPVPLPALALEDAVVQGSGSAPVSVTAGAGDAIVVVGEAGAALAVLAALTGRQHVTEGHALVLGHALPYSARALRRDAVLLTPEAADDPSTAWPDAALDSLPRRAALVAVDLTRQPSAALSAAVRRVDAAVSLSTTVVVAVDAATITVPPTFPGRTTHVVRVRPEEPDGSSSPPPDDRIPHGGEPERPRQDDTREEVTA